MDFDDHRAPRSDVCILLLHHNIALVMHWYCVCYVSRLSVYAPPVPLLLQIKMYIGFVCVIHEFRSQVFIQQCLRVCYRLCCVWI